MRPCRGECQGYFARLSEPFRWRICGSPYRVATGFSQCPPALHGILASMRRDDRVDIVFNSPRLELFPLSLQRSVGPVIVVHSGYVSSGRGMTQMLEALAKARKVADVRMTFCGGVAPSERDLFAATVARHDLAGAIEGPTWVDPKDMGARVCAGHIGILALKPTPNNYGGLGNKLFHYMACGLPCIVPAGSASETLVSQYECGVAVDVTSPDAIASAIVTLAEDVDMRRHLGANGRAAIAIDLGWHRMQERLRRAYEQLGRELQSSL